MEPETIDAEDINKQKDYEILSLTLKDSTKIEKVEPNYINFIKGFPDSAGKFVYSVRHNVYDSNKSYIHTLISADTLPLFKVSKVKIDKDASDYTLPIILVVSIVLVVSLLLILKAIYSPLENLSFDTNK